MPWGTLTEVGFSRRGEKPHASLTVVLIKNLNNENDK